MAINRYKRSKLVLDHVIKKVNSPQPGPKPDRFGPEIVWDGERSRWVDPNEDEGKKKTESKVREAPERLPVSRSDSRKRASEQYRNSPDIQDVSGNEGSYRYYNFEYKELNEALRNNWEIDYDLQEIYEGMKGMMIPLQNDYVVYRGWRNNPDNVRMEVGEIFASAQFTSTTLDSHYAVEWMGYNSSTGEAIRGNPLWQIKVPKGTYGIIPQGVSNDYEVELTIDSSTRFRCVGVQKG